MSDQTTTSELSPSPAETSIPIKHEPFPPSENPVKIGIAQKVRSAASRVITQAGFSFKKGKGRPRNCVECGGVGCEQCGFTGKMPGKLDQPIAPELPENPPEPFPPIPGAPAPAVPAGTDSGISALFRRSCVASVKGALGTRSP